MCNNNYKPTNGVSTHSWLFEAPTANDNTSALTQDGVENIANHKYKPGHYTHLDNILNPFWTYITDLLPMSIAPNLVTAMGGMCCALSYVTLWYYSPNLDQAVPSWVVFLSGVCAIAYYTFDCMDGKQARRTGNSTPLGQLFDHGFDCLCLLSHVSSLSGYLMMGGSYWYIIMQMSLQFSFFMAQWEEYYTNILPHAMGNWFGVTEVNYGVGLMAILNSFIDREKFWMGTVQEWIVPLLPQQMMTNNGIEIPESILSLEMRHVGLTGWFVGLAVLMGGSFIRVLTHNNVISQKLHLSALSKLVTPFIISLSPFILPKEILLNETRYVSIATGLLFSLLTKKMIVFSMAKMTYATFQLEIVPLIFTFTWIKYDGNITEVGATVLLWILSVWYTYRMLNWVSKAIDQICQRLGILCFRIQVKKYL